MDVFLLYLQFLILFLFQVLKTQAVQQNRNLPRPRINEQHTKPTNKVVQASTEIFTGKSPPKEKAKAAIHKRVADNHRGGVRGEVVHEVKKAETPIKNARLYFEQTKQDLSSFFANTSWDHKNELIAAEFLCPLTFHYNLLASSKHYNYPTNIYYRSSIDKESLQNTEKCTVYDSYFDQNVAKTIQTSSIFNCMTNLTFCPIQKENIVAATAAGGTNNWRKSHSFCDLKTALHQPEPINVYVFGSSVTTGVGTQGCRSGVTAKQWNPYTQNILEIYKSCAWPQYFELWLQSISKYAEVKVHNLAFPGYSSQHSTSKFASILKSLKITTFSSRDIIFLDHYTTDMQYLHQHSRTPGNFSAHDYAGVKNIMQNIVNKVHSSCESDHKRPIIILMETETDFNTPHNFSSIYKQVARHNGLHLFSYRDALLHGYSAAQHDVKSSVYLPFIEHLKSTRGLRQDWHPAWYVHLYIADWISAIIIREIALCNNIDSNSVSNNNDNNSSGDTIRAVTDSEPVIDTGPTCDDSVTPLLSISYDAVIKNETTIGSFALPHNYWKLGTDLRGRGGFIRSIANGDSVATHDNATIEFYLNTTGNSAWESAETIAAKNTNITKFMLSITYLASYIHVGVVDVYICNEYMTTIDALWSDRYSVPQTRNILFDRSLCVYDKGINSIVGSNMISESGSSDVVSGGNSIRKNTNIFTVQIKHRIQTTINNGDMSFLLKSMPRFRQMFKITSVDVCQTA